MAYFKAFSHFLISLMLVLSVGSVQAVEPEPIHGFYHIVLDGSTAKYSFVNELNLDFPCFSEIRSLVLDKDSQDYKLFRMMVSNGKVFDGKAILTANYSVALQDHEVSLIGLKIKQKLTVAIDGADSINESPKFGGDYFPMTIEFDRCDEFIAALLHGFKSDLVEKVPDFQDLIVDLENKDLIRQVVKEKTKKRN